MEIKGWREITGEWPLKFQIKGNLPLVWIEFLSLKVVFFFIITILAIIVRVRPEEIVNGNHTLYLVNVKKVFKKNQRMKKKLDVRFNNKTCDCKPKLSFKRAYLVIGNHNVTIRKMASLELDRQSFLAEWDETLEKEMNQVADSCFRNSIVVTPRLANSLQIMTVIKTSGMSPAITFLHLSYSLRTRFILEW